MRRFDIAARHGGFCSRPPHGRPAQERAAALEQYLASCESPSYGSFLAYAGLIEDELTTQVRDAMHAAGLVEPEAPGEASITCGELLAVVETLPHIRKLLKEKE